MICHALSSRTRTKNLAKPKNLAISKRGGSGGAGVPGEGGGRPKLKDHPQTSDKMFPIKAKERDSTYTILKGILSPQTYSNVEPGPDFIELFSNVLGKLECLSLASLFSFA